MSSSEKIITLKVKLWDLWSADIEVFSDFTLEELHYAIQWAVEFDNDHLYEFFVARTEHSKVKARYDDENGEIYNTEVGDLFPLIPKHHLFYLFDYGDSWTFRITKSRKKPVDPVEGIEYPNIVNETGEKPLQYGPVEDY